MERLMGTTALWCALQVTILLPSAYEAAAPPVS